MHAVFLDEKTLLWYNLLLYSAKVMLIHIVSIVACV